MKPTKLAVDVGATFTDVVRLSEGGELTFGKVLATPARPAEGGSHLDCWSERTRLRCASGYYTTAASMLPLTSRTLGEWQRPSWTGATQPLRSRSCVPTQTTLKRKRCGRYWQISIHRSTCHCPLTYHAGYREDERTSDIRRRSSSACTAVLDADHADRAHEPARAEQGPGRTRSGGGAMTATTARELPVNLTLSGPMGHVIRSRGVLEDRRRFRPCDDRYGPCVKVWEGARCQLR